VVAVSLTVLLLLGWSIRIPSTHPFVKITSLDRALALVSLITAVLLATSPYARVTARHLLSSPAAFFLVITLLAGVMSLGPTIVARGRVVEEGTLYALLFRTVPGFDGLRVPARFGMIVAFGLAALAGCGAAALGPVRRFRGIVWAASALIVIDGCAMPIPINVNDTTYKQAHLAALPGAVVPHGSAVPVYAFAARLPASSVLLELPLGEPAFDVRYMYYALEHGHPLVNGYSGGAPTEYLLLGETLKDFAASPARAWQAIVTSGATHVIVHEAAYEPGRGERISQWLTASGAREVAAFDTDRVFEVR
jgi:hypothetical protein